MFTLVHDNKGETPAVEMLPKGSAAIAVGEPLKFDSGKLVNNASATTVPLYISNAKAAASDEYVAAVKVTSEQFWETQLNAAFTPIVGTKYALVNSSPYDKLTSTTSSGIARVVKDLGHASGDPVIVCFD